MICLQNFILLCNVGCFVFVGSDADCIEFIAEKRQREGIMAKLTPITAEGCVEICEDLNTCFAVNYFRLNATCQLLNRTMPESKLIKTTKCFYKAVRRPLQESIDNDPCFKLMCPWDEICMHNTTTNLAECYPFCKNLPAIPGTLNEMVEIEVGQNYTYRCRDGLFGKSDQISTVTCLRDGHWTGTNFTCVCTNPPAIPGTLNGMGEIEVGQNYTYRCRDGLFGKSDQISTVTCLRDGHWTGTNFTCVCNTPPTKYGAISEMAEVEVGQNYSYKCESGLFEKGDLDPTIKCLEHGSWTSTNFQCVKQNWKQDTIYYNNIHTSDLISNVTRIDLLECMRQCDDNRNNCLSFFYDNQSSQCLLSSSFRRGLPQNLQSSQGLVYYTAPSTSCDMGYMNVSLGGSYFCIKFSSIAKTFNEAMKLCESDKAKLLVVTTKDQIADLKPHLPGGWTYGYVGISDETKEGYWTRWDGAAVNLFWNPGEPNGGIYENCGCIAPYSIGLFEAPCNWHLTFVCSKT